MSNDSTDTIQTKAGRPKSEEKRQQILKAASDEFLAQGFANTSMDKIAKSSGVSKQTVYSHFDSKDTLFQAAILQKCQSYELDPTQLSGHDQCELPMAQCLTIIGRQFMRLIQDPDVIAMYRTVISEAKNNRRIAELFYQAGLKASLDGLATLFLRYSQHRLSQQQALAVATDFLSLLKSDRLLMLLCDLAAPLDDAQIDRHVARVVDQIGVLLARKTSQT
ncbi:TetR/AcrR family transcriptional regulator [Alteromonas halophila]|uniref:Transcriptional regulator n=1 Tax=Alteromonas halophila TaxID=516698 RepID=A0A918MVK3_9ALTE|nr:TetR/AcrR family transcriptional regulator [Alteromonas halophila]GGW78684.1 transcriptional regulator [Alteromonas halophila]